MALPALPPGVPYGRLVLFCAIFLIAFFAAFRDVVFGDSHSSLTPYLCNTTSEMIRCDGPLDVATCADAANSFTGGTGADCVPSSCGHRLAHGLDVSVSGADTPPGPTAGRGNGTPTDVRSGLMIFWSLVPYLLAFVLLALFLWCGDTSTLSFIVMLFLVAAVNELIFKNVLRQNRPEGSCLYFDCFGMPSGHAATSVGALTYSTLEILVDRPDLPPARKFALFAAAAILLAPVPHSRVYLNDHLRGQVVVGSSEGVVVAILWFLFTYRVARHRLDGWIDHRCCRCFGLRNTYRNGVPYCPDWSPCGRSADRVTDNKGGDEEEEGSMVNEGGENGEAEMGGERSGASAAAGMEESDVIYIPTNIQAV